ncbi:uncharacterized protein LOC135173658 [Pogoniulus pusillus]|uniref:uncharacterized protein LOC135173658 n=1 Tax=Pogoniulus pusillus TaxID=488313 RepID=UPI0030B99D13
MSLEDKEEHIPDRAHKRGGGCGAVRSPFALQPHEPPPPLRPRPAHRGGPGCCGGGVRGGSWAPGGSCWGEALVRASAAGERAWGREWRCRGAGKDARGPAAAGRRVWQRGDPCAREDAGGAPAGQEEAPAPILCPGGLRTPTPSRRELCVGAGRQRFELGPELVGERLQDADCAPSLADQEPTVNPGALPILLLCQAAETPGGGKASAKEAKPKSSKWWPSREQKHSLQNGKCNLTGWWENDLGSKMLVSMVDSQGNFSGEYHTAVSSAQKPIEPSPLVGSQHLDKDGQCTFGFTVNWKKFSDSTAVFVGQCFTEDNGEEVLQTSWLLREKVDTQSSDWKATRTGHNIFTRVG